MLVAVVLLDLAGYSQPLPFGSLTADVALLVMNSEPSVVHCLSGQQSAVGVDHLHLSLAVPEPE